MSNIHKPLKIIDIMNRPIETTGYTIKEEKVDFLKHHILPNTLVVNVNHPFPGYHGQPMIDKFRPRSILLVTKNKYSWEKIIRAAQKINKFTDYDINCSAATIAIGNNFFFGIRVKGLPSYEEIPLIQNAFQEEGLVLMKRRRYKDDLTVSIKVSKYYNIEKIEENLYKDSKTEHMYYIAIPNHLNWELFRKITYDIKNNISNRNYDVSVGIFFMDNTIVDMVRVFKPNIKIELLREIKDRYHKEIERYF